VGEIYLLTFSNGKRYVGATMVGARKRYAGHKGAVAAGAVTPVCSAWRTHGEPDLSIICVVENVSLIDAEEKAIKKFNTLWPRGYNRAAKSNAVGVEVSAATRAKIAASKIGLVLSKACLSA
jgi:predicted GIY-YIG superfamily endonuclease